MNFVNARHHIVDESVKLVVVEACAFGSVAEFGVVARNLELEVWRAEEIAEVAREDCLALEVWHNIVACAWRNIRIAEIRCTG